LTDQAERQAETRGTPADRLRLAARLGTLPLEPWRDVGLTCHPVTLAPGESRAVVAARAFWGDEVARELNGGPPGGVVRWGYGEDVGGALAAGLALAADLPPVVTKEECSSKRCHDGIDWSTHSIPVECERCAGAGTRRTEVPLRDYLGVVASVAAALVALLAWEEDHLVGHVVSVGRWPCCSGQRLAVDAGAAWLVCPCSARREAMHRALLHVPTNLGRMDWLDLLLNPQAAVQAAAKVADPEAVRAAIRAAVLRVLAPEERP